MRLKNYALNLPPIPMTVSPFKHIAIVGVGLIGGSLAKLIHQQSPQQRLTLVDPTPEVQTWIHPSIDHQPSIKHLADTVDLIIIATPLDQVADDCRTALTHTSAIVTDVASVKGPIIESLTPDLHERFIPGHPMMGTTHSGFQASDATLCDQAPYLLIPGYADISPLANWLTSLGFQVHTLSSDEHDQAVAWISHVPYLLSATLAHQTQLTVPLAPQFAGPGFQSMTRLAQSSPDWARHIMSLNKTAVLDCLDSIIQALQEQRHAIASGSFTPSTPSQ